MARITYNDALFDSSSLFSNAQTEQHYVSWNLVLETGDKPLEAYKIFQTKEAAEVVVQGDNSGGETLYDVYPGAVISVVKDPVEGNNGLYHVEPNDSLEAGAPKYKLVKMLSEEDGATGSITVKMKTYNENQSHQQGDSSLASGDDRETPFIFFVGVDNSTNLQHPDTLYFHDGIAYDAEGGNLVSTSDTRLKNIIAPVNIDLDRLCEIDKVYFTWKDDNSGKTHIGVTAQSVEEVYPELVTENPETGIKMVNYDGLSVIALAAVDALKTKIDILEERLNDFMNSK